MKPSEARYQAGQLHKRLSHALAIWLMWQGVWHLAFEYVIRYPQYPIALLVSIKLITELLFYALLAIWLCRDHSANRLFKIALLIGLLSVFLLTLRQWLKNWGIEL